MVGYFVFCYLNFISNSHIQKKNRIDPYLSAHLRWQIKPEPQLRDLIRLGQHWGLGLSALTCSPTKLSASCDRIFGVSNKGLLPNNTMELWGRHRHLPVQIPTQTKRHELWLHEADHNASLGHLCPCFRPDRSWRPEVGQFLHMLSLSLLTSKNSMRTAVF